MGSREIHLDALFVWSVVHGMATILQTAALHQLGLDEATLRGAMPHALERIGRALTRATSPVPVASNAGARPGKRVRGEPSGKA